MKLTPSLPLLPGLTFSACRMGEGSEDRVKLSTSLLAPEQDRCAFREGDSFIFMVQGLRMCLASLDAEREPMSRHVS